MPFLSSFISDWIPILLFLSQCNNCCTYLRNGWNVSQLVLMICQTNLHDSNYCDNVFNSPEAGPRDNRQCMHAAATQERASCGAHVWLGVTGDRRHVCLVSVLCLAAENGSHVTRSTTYSSVSQPRTSIYCVIFLPSPLFLFSLQKVYLKNAVSHITEFFSCSVVSLDSVAYLIRRFILKLEVEQTPDKAVAPSQPVL